MAKLMPIKSYNSKGERVIAGYRVALQKVLVERCGFKEGDILKIDYKKGEIRIKKK